MISRRKTRELLMQLLYQMTLLGDYTEEAKTRFLTDYAEEHPDEEPDHTYFDKTFSLVMEHLSDIDEAITGASDNWKLSRISKVDLSILRMALGEILFSPDIPEGVSVNEAVELAKKYGSDNSPKFINGLLGKVLRN
ncbi:MAG: transcription antitermination factor NusB [Clostridiales Family XIII bacterium]|jgi:N utilization substance protein B|nr:transcription antitermination factor NusB [Clostridiales Family XIII bacterium]